MRLLDEMSRMGKLGNTFTGLRTLIFLLSCVVVSKGDYPFGSSDPLTQGLPEWELQPLENYYVVRNKPVTITCRATPAIQVPATYLLKNDLRRHFDRFPVAKRVEKGKQAELDCLPPEGKPLPTVYFGVCSYVDGGSATCRSFWSSSVALLGVVGPSGGKALVRATLAPPFLTLAHPEGRIFCAEDITVARRNCQNGGWSSWNEWTECSVTCGKGKQRRSRTCTVPSPYNGGLPCEGEQQQSVTCGQYCADKRQQGTTRSPRPSRTSTEAGLGLSDSGQTDQARDEATATADDDEDVSLYIGICVSVAVVFVIVIVVVFMCRRHSRRRSAFRDLGGPDATQSLTEDEKKQKNGDMLSMQPDLTQTVVVTVQHNNHNHHHNNHNNQTYNHSQGSNESPNNNHVGSVDKMPGYHGGGGSGGGSSIGGSGPESPFIHDSSPSYSVPDVPGMYPQAGMEPGQYSVPDTQSYISNGRPYSPIAQPLYSPQTPQSYSSGAGGNQGGPTPYSSTATQQFFPSDKPPQRHSGGMATPGCYSGVPGPNNKMVMVEPTINHNLNNASVEKLGMKDSKSGLPPPAPSSCDGRPLSQCDSLQDSRQSVISVQLPGNVDTEAVTWSTFNHTGGRLFLPESGVLLTVPEGAIKKGHVEELYMAVCRDDKDRPRLTEHQTILSPVILVGPPSVQLLKPVILSFQHCANMRQGGWVLSIYKSESPIDEPPYWRRVVVLGHETINSPIYTQLDPNQCHVMTEFLNRYTLIGESVPGGRALKIYRLAAFAPAMPPSVDYSIRVYVVEDTIDALDGVIQVERKLGGRLLDKPKQIPFQDGGNNLCLTIEELSSGWRSKLAANYQEIPFRHIWSGNQNNLHCSFSLELQERSVSRLACKIQVYQKAILSNRQTLLINCNLKDNAASCPGQSNTLKQRSSTVNTAASTASSGFHSMVTLDPSAQVFRLPSHIKAQLCMLLDPPNARGNDWRMLAQALTVDRYINFFATKSSPTEHILDLWEARHREDTAVTDLMNILRVMGRMDAAAVLEKDNGSWL
ncbi:netrin receptor UNC5B-b [Aplysia californica]|uniref:Netrin receptor UNC5 n=1 Tax=Aplysia californica TaxID=6500 RepID=A0ABM1VNX9_APLCA|nr:netrin receptor UNC5B-b [Aplysia californica]